MLDLLYKLAGKPRTATMPIPEPTPEPEVAPEPTAEPVGGKPSAQAKAAKASRVS